MPRCHVISQCIDTLKQHRSQIQHMHTVEREARTVELMWTPSGVPVVQSLAVAPSVRLVHVVVVV